MIIYLVRNKKTGKKYIGQTIQSLERRWRGHCSGRSGCRALHNAILKYGKENFTIKQIDAACNRDELDKKEAYWIEFYDCIVPNGYNLTAGGGTCRFSYETRQKMSQSAKGKPKSQMTDEHKRHVSESLKRLYSDKRNHPSFGKKRSEETKRKISEANRGRKLSDKQREIAITALSQNWKSGEEHPMWGKHHTEESRKKMSESRKGVYLGGKAYNAKSVLCVETGKVFDSVSTAGREMNIESKNINAVVVGKRNRAGGYHWRYAE